MKDSDVIIEYEKHKTIPSKFLKHCSTEMLNYIQNRFNDSTCDKESLLRIVYNVIERPVCTCGNPVVFVGKPSKLFTKYCSNKCKFDNTNMVERHKQGCLKKYGVENISQLESIKKKKEQTFIKHFGTKNNFGRKEVNEKIKQTYGVDNISQLESIKLKKIETQFKNNSFNHSKSENDSYVLLKNYYPDVVRQYKCARYPFNCDFYIPSIDVFIECQYFWTHGYHPFDSNNIDDQNRLKSLKDKYKNNWWHTWVEYDTKKRSVAKENKLKYIEVWNIEELKDILNNCLENYNFT